MRADLLKNYPPHPELVEIADDVAAGLVCLDWCIQLSPEVTVVELAALMHGLGCKVRADHQGDGVYQIWPIDPTTPPPTEEHIRDILARGFDGPLPALMACMEN